MTTPIQRVCVYCGSSNGVPEVYLDSASAMGRALASRRLTLGYGGGSTGLMGALADGAPGAGGDVIGVITAHLNTPDLARAGLTEMRVVESMHARKSAMAQMAHVFVALPGGLGTMEELFEVLTWAQIGLHDRPIGLLNVRSYFDPLLSLIDHARQHGFLHNTDRVCLIAQSDPDSLLDHLIGGRSV